MTDEELAAIRARLHAATPGEWETNFHDSGASVKAPGRTVAELTYRDNPRDENDATFIACAKQDIVVLLAEVDRLRALIATWRDARCQRMPGCDRPDCHDQDCAITLADQGLLHAIEETP